MRVLSIVIITFCLSNFSVAQKSDIGNWFLYFGNQKINEKWNWHNEIQYRNYNFVGDTNQLLLRTGIGYNLTENNNNLLLGYGYINSQNYIANSNQKVHVNEHRIFQQFITKQNFGRLFLQHRYRVEERFIKDQLNFRFRYLIGINIPLNKKLMEKETVYFSAYNEIFINKSSPLFDRNRLYGAIGYIINKNFKIEAGFMAQSVENSSRNQFQLALHNSLPF